MLMDFTSTFYICYGSMLLLGLSLCVTGKQYWGVGIFAVCIAWAATISLIRPAISRGYIFLFAPSFVIGVLTFVAGFSPSPLVVAFILVYYGRKYLSFRCNDSLYTGTVEVKCHTYTTALVGVVFNVKTSELCLAMTIGPLFLWLGTIFCSLKATDYGVGFYTTGIMAEFLIRTPQITRSCGHIVIIAPVMLMISLAFIFHFSPLPAITVATIAYYIHKTAP